MKSITFEKPSNDDKINETIIKNILRHLTKDFGIKFAFIAMEMENGRKIFWRTETNKGMFFESC